MSSVSSVDSRFSTSSDLSAWSNIESSDISSEAGYNPDFAFAFPAESVVSPQESHVSRASGLTLDPRLFQSSQRGDVAATGDNSNPIGYGGEGLVDGPELVTAKPKVKSPRKTAEKKANGGEPKKVSHARKVSAGPIDYGPAY